VSTSSLQRKSQDVGNGCRNPVSTSSTANALDVELPTTTCPAALASTDTAEVDCDPASCPVEPSQTPHFKDVDVGPVDTIMAKPFEVAVSDDTSPVVVSSVVH